MKKRVRPVLVLVPLIFAALLGTSFAEVYYDYPCLNFRGRSAEEKLLQQNINDNIFPYTIYEDIKAYVSWGRELLASGKSARPAFGRAIEKYVYYLYYHRDKDLEETKTICPLLKWVREAYSRYGDAKNQADFEALRQQVIDIDQKEYAFWLNLYDAYLNGLYRELSEKYYGSDTLYEIAEAFLAQGREFLSLGQRLEAKQSFYRAMYRRALNEAKPHINYFRIPSMKMIEDSYKPYKTEEYNKDLEEIANAYYYIWTEEKKKVDEKGEKNAHL